MLTKFKITNFQKHENLSLEFEQITTIIGKNGAGKSSVIRALDFLFNNQPRGSSFVRHGETECEVKAKLDDHVIRRVKTAKTNEYFLDDQKFAAFGSDVPDSIKTFVNINELNLQKQLDAALWFHLSPLEISRKLNKIVNLDMIDTCLKGVAEQLYSANQEVKFHEQAIQKEQETVEKTSWVVEAEEKIIKLKEKQSLLQEKKQELRDMQELNRKIVELVQKIKKLPNIDFSSVDTKIESLQEWKSEYAAMSNHSYKWNQAEIALKTAKDVLEHQKEEMEQLSTLECPLCGK